MTTTIDPDRLVTSFLKWAQVNAPSGQEHTIADLLAAQLQGMGFQVRFDEAHRQTGGNCGNLIARWDGTRPCGTVLEVA